MTPTGADPSTILFHLVATWLLMLAVPVAIWMAVYYAWLKRRWEPHFRQAEEAERQAGRA